MGLDAVEIIMRTEEVFAVVLPDEECGQVRTVGDLYRLVLSKLDVSHLPSREIESTVGGRDRSRSKHPGPELWSAPDVWLTIKGIIWAQLGADPHEITEDATFQDDLRCD